MEPTTEQLMPQQIHLTTAAIADELDFVIGWRHIRAGHMLSQGAANHMTSVTELPEALRAALLAWLT
jgi:hypothetical protein